MRKRAVTLIEVIICLGLLTLLLTTLSFWYRTLTSHKSELNKSKWSVMEERYAYQRLQQILPQAKLPFFTCRDGSLVFLFDRGLFPDPLLSNTVLGRLYHDTEQQALCLGIWPEPGQDNLLKTPSQTIILLDQVSDLSFQFYYPPDPLKKTVDPKEVGKPEPEEKWQESWRGEYQKLPALIKMYVTRGERKNKYYFDLPFPIIYPAEIGA